MNVTGIDQNKLIADITTAVTIAVRDEISSCMCPLAAEDRKEIPLLYDVYKELGNGNLAQGIRRSRSLFMFVGDIYNRKTMVTGAVLAMIVLGAFGMLGKWVWAGLIQALRGQ